MSSNIRSLVMLIVGLVVGGGLVLLLQKQDEDGVVRELEESVAASPELVAEDRNAGRGPAEIDGSEETTPEADPWDGEDADGVDGEPSFEDLMAKVFAGDATDDEQLAFWKQMRKTDKIDGVIEDFRVQVEEDAEDVKGRMTLAQLYLMKLLSAPNGPERGLLSEKSQALWGQVLELEPDHFEAQFQIAFSLSQYPDFLNKTDEAIEGFEKAIAIEERIGASDQTAQAYVNLARIHQKGGDPASALEVLERAAKAHPEHAEIGGQLEKLKRGYVFEGEGE